MPRDWNTFLKGAFAERLEEEFEKVAENIQDPNYDAKAKRQTVIVIDFLGDEYREIADISVIMHSKLPKKLPVKSRMLFNRDSKGKAVCAELGSADPKQLELTVSDEGATEVQANNGVDLLQRI